MEDIEDPRSFLYSFFVCLARTATLQELFRGIHHPHDPVDLGPCYICIMKNYAERIDGVIERVMKNSSEKNIDDINKNLTETMGNISDLIDHLPLGVNQSSILEFFEFIEATFQEYFGEADSYGSPFAFSVTEIVDCTNCGLIVEEVKPKQFWMEMTGECNFVNMLERYQSKSILKDYSCGECGTKSEFKLSRFIGDLPPCVVIYYSSRIEDSEKYFYPLGLTLDRPPSCEGSSFYEIYGLVKKCGKEYAAFVRLIPGTFWCRVSKSEKSPPFWEEEDREIGISSFSPISGPLMDGTVGRFGKPVLAFYSHGEKLRPIVKDSLCGY